MLFRASMTTIMKVLGAALAVGSLTAGCVADDANDELGVSYAPGIREGQGREQMGSLPDGYTGPLGHLFAVSSTAFSVGPVYVNGACLALSPNGPCAALTGARSTGSDSALITIIGSVPGPLPNTRIYDVQHDGTPLCPNGAYPTAGAWTPTGFHDNLAGYLSFGCLDPGGDQDPTLSNHQGGVSGKAIAWGFVPGPVGSQAWKDHQLATVMGRSDYCGDGTVRTINATPIKHYLPLGLAHPPFTAYPQTIVAGAFYPEAAWATAANNESRGATCLAKLRWSARPVGDLCGGALPDPRLHTVEQGGGFCEDKTPIEIWASGARIFNDSQYNAVGLWQWTKATDHYASTGGFYAGVRAAQTVLPPGAGAAYASSDTGRIGNVLTDDGKATYLATYSGATFVELVTAKHASNGDFITTIASAVPPNYGAIRHEGWLFATVPANQPPNAVFTALYRHKQTFGTDTMVSTNPTEAGFTNQMTLGYMLDF